MKRATALIVLFFLFVLIVVGVIVFFSLKDDGERPDTELNLSLDARGGVISDADDFTLNDYGYYVKVVQRGDYYGTLPTAEREGYIFLGWSEVVDGELIGTQDVIAAEDDFMLYAVYEWVGITVSYTVRYVDTYGAEIAQSLVSTAIEGTEVELQPIEITGYTLNTELTDLTPIINRNRVYDIIYTPNTYYINLAVSDEIVYADSVDYEYNSTVTLPNFSEISSVDDRFNLVGMHFVGWQVGENLIADGGEITLNDMLTLGLDASNVGSAVNLIAVYEPNEYRINFNSQCAQVYTAPADYNGLLPEPTFNVPDGYAFVGWYLSDTGATGTDIAGQQPIDMSKFTVPANDLELYAGYTLLTYSITLHLNGGQYPAGESNPTEYTVESDFILVAPEKVGSTFVGWIGAGMTDPVPSFHVINMTGNIELSAVYEDEVYTIVYNLDGGDFAGSICPTTYTQSSADIAVTAPVRAGYEFMGWTGTDLSAPTIDLVISQGSMGNREYTATWRAEIYDIHYVLNNGSLNTTHNTYTVEDEPFTLNIPTRAGYDFVGWSIDDSEPNPSYIFVPSEHLGDVTFTAVWSASGYAIKYDFAGGSQAAGGNYPDSYTTEESVTPTDPVRAGYDFTGWTLYNERGTELFEDYIILGSTGERRFVANWSPRTDTKYTVNIFLMNELGEYLDSPDSSETRTGTTDTLVTVTPEDISGYITPESEQVTILGDGSGVVNLYYERVQYTLTIAGNGITAIEEQDYYHGATITITAELLDGYDFTTWTQTSGTTVELSIDGTSVTFVMPESAVTLTATTSTIPYTITYDLGEGTVATPNPTEYTVETPTFTLNNPTREGYIFTGWTGTGLSSPTMTVTITVGSTGNRSYTANFEPAPVDYTVNHYWQNIENDEYTLHESITEQAQAGSSVTAPLQDYEGFSAPATQQVTVNADGSSSVDYYYTRNNYTVTIATTDDGILSTSGADTYRYGATVTLSAEMYEYYSFLEWLENDERVSTNATYTFTLEAHDYTIHARSVGQTFSITYNNVDDTSTLTTQYTYNRTSDFSFKNNPNRDGAIFIGWQNNNEPTDLTLSDEIEIPAGTHGTLTYTAQYSTGSVDYLSYTALSDNTAEVGKHFFTSLPDDVVIPDYVYLKNGVDSSSISSTTGYIVDKSLFDAGFENIYKITQIRGGSYSDSGWSYSNYAFAQSDINSITLPDTLERIGVGSFLDSTVQTVNFGSGVTRIGEYAFNGCTGLTSVSIPSSVTEIAVGAFFRCSRLSSIAFAEGLTTIGMGAFQQTALTNITFPSSLTSIGVAAFNKLGLQTVNFGANTQLTEIGSQAFYNNYNLTSVTFGVNCSIGTIGASAFAYCPSLKTINIPEQINVISEYAFSDATSLYEIGLTENSTLTQLGENAFQNCHSLVEVVIPDTCMMFGSSPFNQCYNLRRVNMQNLPRGDEDWKDILFGTGDNYPYAERGQTESEFTGTIEVLDNGIVLWNKKTPSSSTDADTSVIINYHGTSGVVDLTSTDITKVGDRAFAYNLTIQELRLPITVRQIGAEPFNFADNLTTIVWPYNSSIASLASGNGGYTVNTSSFAGAHKLVQLGLPFDVDDLTFEGDATLIYDSDGIEIINTNGSETFATTFSTSGDYTTVTFGGTSALVGQTYLLTYNGTATTVGLSGQTNIYAGLFAGNRNITSVTLPSGMTAIPDAMFIGAYNLQSINIPTIVTSIGDNAFRLNFSLTSANISELTNLTEIGKYAFDLCISWTDDIEIAGSVTVISEGAFRGCFNITSVTLNEGTERLEAYCFQATGGITDETFTLPSTVNYIHEEAFRDNENYQPPQI